MGAVQTTPYRSADAFLRAEVAARLEELARKAPRVAEDVRAVYARRVGRSAAGGFAILGAVVIAATAVSRAVGPAVLYDHEPGPTLTALLMWTVALVPFAYVAARAVSPFLLTRAVGRMEFRPTDDARADLERARAWTIEHRAATVIRRWEMRSVALPLVGSALVVPLTLHLPVWALFASPTDDVYREFDKWMVMSMVIVGHAHLVLAAMGWLYARKLSRWSPNAGELPRGALGAMIFTCIAGAVPGAVFLLIPPILVAVTGAVFVPASYAYCRHAILGERHALESAEELALA